MHVSGFVRGCVPEIIKVGLHGDVDPQNKAPASQNQYRCVMES